ncbi:hypothetical protein G5I_03461 [Acromyrmex echinatior]|uniref:Uncharacterized protein n=1 Tax=Acromyrmex echinatior TaxID=103372 RepID=F4WD19_ACREC|nr:hypothetical protein G5I_03461 [Acromyrmex echinatior]
MPQHLSEAKDHVQKRMGTHLRNLKKRTKGLGGKGKSTGKLIDELSIYFGLAIRRNCESVEKMKTAIWATFTKYLRITIPNTTIARLEKIHGARGKGRNLLTFWLPIRTNH